MTHKDRGILIWGTAIAILFAIATYFASLWFTDNQQHWFTPVGILIAWALYITWSIAAKWTLFVSYHGSIMLTIYVFQETLLRSMFDFEWIYGFDWIRSSLIVIYFVTIAGSLTASVLSCWSSTYLKEDQIGQLSIFGKMVNFGISQVNGILFTGLPSYLVKVIPYSAKTSTKTTTSTIQIPIFESTDNSHFQAEFEWNFRWKIANTKKWALNDGNEPNLVNAGETEMNRWVNNPLHPYKDIKELQTDLTAIKRYMNETVIPYVLERYGVEIVNFNLERIELPKKLIEKQNTNAAKLLEQTAEDARQERNMASLAREANSLVNASPKDKDGQPTLTFKEAMAIVQTESKKIHATQITGSGAGRVLLDADDGGGHKR